MQRVMLAAKLHRATVTDRCVDYEGSIEIDENLMDAVTAISGSGPAYVFYLIEALAGAGEKIGLSAEHSMQLARQTIIGAAALAEDEAETSASTLRQNVTSPGGTTEAALDVLMDGDFQRILNKAVTAARDRGKELSS